MSADRELLEAAAKAAGYDHLVWTEGASPIIPGAFRPPNSKCYWNPLTDDGDAFRLAVKLRIDVQQYEGYVVAWFDGGYIGTGRVPYEADPYAATRRAIVMAAAELPNGST